MDQLKWISIKKNIKKGLCDRKIYNTENYYFTEND